MNQRVTARIVGGKRFTTAEYREYFNASRILRDQANRLGTSRRSFIAAGYELKIHPRATPLLSALTGASPRCTAQDHIELPYRQLLGRCEAHAEALQSMASQLNELSSLIAQAQSLYAQAEEASRKGLNIMLRGLFMSSRESAILALTASALMGVRRSYAKEGEIQQILSCGIHRMDAGKLRERPRRACEPIEHTGTAFKRHVHPGIHHENLIHGHQTGSGYSRGAFRQRLGQSRS